MDNNKIIKLIKEKEEEIDKLLCSSLGEFISSSEYYKKINGFISQVLENIPEEELSEILEKLNELKEKLQKYEKFIIANKTLNLKLENNDKSNIDKEVLMFCVKQIIRILNEVEKENIDKDDEAKDLFAFFYSMAYDLMKKELLFSSDSLIYEYISEKEERKSFIEGLINKEYNKLKESILNNDFDKITQEKLLKDLFDIEFNEEKRLINEVLSIETNNQTNLFNIDTIKLLTRYDINNKKYIEEVNKKIRLITDELKEIYQKLCININDKKDYSKSLDDLIVERNKNKKELKIRIGSIILSLSILGTLALGSSNFFRKRCMNKCYNGTITTYSSVDNKSSVTPMLFQVDDEISKEIKINVYSKVYNDGLLNLDKVRIKESYDVTEFELDNIDDYFEMNLSDLDYEIAEIDYKKDSPMKQYTEVVEVNVDKSKEIESLDKFKYYLEMTTYLFLVDIVLSFISVLVRIKRKDLKKIYVGSLFNIVNIFNENSSRPYISLYNDLNIYKERKNRYLLNVIAVNEEIDFLLSRYKEKRKEFDYLYDQYRYLLDNSGQLIKSIKEMEEKEDIKKLIRRKNG